MGWAVWTMLTLLMMIRQLYSVHSRDPCIAFEDIEVCSSYSTWAFGTPNLTVNDTVGISLTRGFSVQYSLELANSSAMSLCGYAYSYPSTSCSEIAGEYCIDCINSVTATSSVTTVFSIPDINMEKNGSKLLLTVSLEGIVGDDVHTFTVTACPESVDGAVSASPVPCGYNCESQFNCTDNYIVNDNVNPNATYLCSAAATWNVPTDICIKDSGKGTTTITPSETDTATTETTVTSTTDTAATETTVTTTTGGGSKLDAQRKKLEIALSLIGGLSILAGFDYKELMPLAAALVCCMLAWGILIGVNAGVAEFAAFVSASVLGSFALLGMVVVIVLLILQLKGGGDKGIKGKEAAEKDVSLNKQ